jgi:hypothetical protein
MATLTFTNTYVTAVTDDASAGMPPDDGSYYMSYRADWTTTSGFTTVEWDEWVDQVEDLQEVISATFGADARSAVYSFLSWIMAEAEAGAESSTGLTGWAYVIYVYEAWAQDLASGDLWSSMTRDQFFDTYSWETNCTVCPSQVEGLRILSTTQYNNMWAFDDPFYAITGWLRYMWGAIHNDGVLESSDVSNGYST